MECFAANLPAGFYGCCVSSTMWAGVAQVYATGQGRAIERITVGLVTALANSSEEVGMLDAVAKNSADEIGGSSHCCASAVKVESHVEADGNEVKTVNVLPLMKGGKKPVGILAVKR